MHFTKHIYVYAHNEACCFVSCSLFPDIIIFRCCTVVFLGAPMHSFFSMVYATQNAWCAMSIVFFSFFQTFWSCVLLSLSVVLLLVNMYVMPHWCVQSAFFVLANTVAHFYFVALFFVLFPFVSFCFDFIGFILNLIQCIERRSNCIQSPIHEEYFT